MIWDVRHLAYRLIAWLGAVATAAVTVSIVRSAPGDSLADTSVLGLTAEILAGLLLVAVGLALHARRGVRALLAGAGIAWLIGEWNSPGAGAAFTVGLVLYAAWPPLLAHAALRHGDCSLGGPAIALLGVAYADSVLLLGAGPALFFDPVEQGCLDCPANRLLVVAHPQVVHDLGRAGLVVAGVWATAFVVLALLQAARSPRSRRWMDVPVLLPASAAIGFFGVRALHGAERGFLSNDPTDHALWAGELGALVLVATGVAWARLRVRRMRGQLARLVVDLGHSPPPGGLRDQLARVLDDPSLELLHALDDDGGWVDGEGQPAELPHGPERQITRLVAGGRELSVAVHRPGLFDAPGMADELADAARLALEHERLNAIRRAQLQRLRASRRRVVATADAERRSLERDLHDGAQQRLATLAVAIRLARRQHAAHDSRLDPELAAAEEGLRDALAQLRELAHGLIPAVLAHEGLGPAVEALADRSSRLVIGNLPGERFATPVESAAYFVVAESLRRSADGDVAVSAWCDSGRLLVRLEAAGGLSGATTDLEDRVGAVGGTLAARPHEVLAEIPCES